MNNNFITHFSVIEDPRIERCKKHQLIDILFLSICAVMSGSEGWEDIEDFGLAKLDWLQTYLPFSNGIPKHDTIARVLSRLNPVSLQQCFIRWVQDIAQQAEGDVIAIDGKSARRTFTTKDRANPLHMVSAWSCANGIVLGQQKVEDKSNEITAIPELLNLLDIENCIITLDAMGCQQAIAQQIVQANADYILALKGNHSGLQTELEAWWHKCVREGLTDDTYQCYEHIDSGHGRIETRCCEQLVIDTHWLDKAYRWKGLNTVIKITSKIEEKHTGKVTQEMRYYISSLPLNAAQALRAVRSHWQVESMHWTLDMTFREDESKIRKGTGPMLFNVLRKIAMNLYRQEDTEKASLKQKRKMAAFDDEYRKTLPIPLASMSILRSDLSSRDTCC